MEPVLANVPTDRIEWADTTFAMRRYAAADDLVASLTRMGIVQPLSTLKSESGRLIVMDGHQRLDWARAAGTCSVPCLVYPAGTSIDELWRRRLEQKLFGPELNLAEKAQLISRFRTVLDDAELIQRILPQLGVRTGAGSLDRWQALAAAGDPFLAPLANGTISERAALELIDWPEDARLEALRVLVILRCSASIQVEILEAIQEIALRRGTDCCAVMNREASRRILASEDLNHRRKTQALREQLARWRFPRLSARQTHVCDRIRAAALPGAIQIRPPRSFEGGVWNLEIAFSNSTDLAGNLDAVRGFAASGNLQAAMAMPEPTTSCSD